MPISFPANQAAGNTYTINGVTWTYSGKMWKRSASSSSGISAVYPANVSDQVNTSTGYLAVSSGNTLQRSNTTPYGGIRYNATTGFAEVYTVGGWGIFGALPPSISSISPQNFSGESGTTITISGNNFTSDIAVKFVTSAGTEISAGTVTFVNSSEVQATTPRDFTVAEEPLDIKITQASGTTTITDILDAGTLPAWTTSSGLLGNLYYPGNTDYNFSLVATDSDSGGTIVNYEVVSGTLPTGASLYSNGNIRGSFTDPNASVTTNTFNVIATDNAGNQSTSRQFTIIRKWRDGSSQDQAAANANVIYNLSSSFRTANANGKYWIQLPGQSASQVYCVMDHRLNNGAWMLSYHKATGSTLNYTYKQLWYSNSSWNNTTFSHDTTNYPVLPNNISFANMQFTKQLFHNQHPSWISAKGNYHWYNLQTNLAWAGTEVTANNYTLSTLTESTTGLWPRGVGWGTATDITFYWGWWASGANGGLCGGAFQCATAACPSASTAEGCHINSTYPLLIFVK